MQANLITADRRAIRSPLKTLSPRDVLVIDDALHQVGAFGEVHLVIEKGRLRYLRTVRSQAIVGSGELERSTQ